MYGGLVVYAGVWGLIPDGDKIGDEQCCQDSAWRVSIVDLDYQLGEHRKVTTNDDGG